MSKRTSLALTAMLLTTAYWLLALWYTNKTASGKDLVVFSKIAAALQLESSSRDLYQYFWQFAMAALLFFVVPKVLKPHLFGTNTAVDGLSLSLNREALMICMVAYPIVIASTYFSSQDPLIFNEYPLSKQIASSWTAFIFYEVCYFSYFFSYEYFFRGFVSFGLVRSGTKFEMLGIILFQTVLTTLFHIGKPMPEIIAAAAFGPVFGFIAFRYGSIWYGMIIHYVMNIFIDYFSLYWQHLLPNQ
ncbi:MAG: CPBP family intramembrane glutamic endopeptidase [Chitinophagales bacterium]